MFIYSGYTDQVSIDLNSLLLGMMWWAEKYLVLKERTVQVEEYKEEYI